MGWVVVMLKLESVLCDAGKVGREKNYLFLFRGRKNNIK